MAEPKRAVVTGVLLGVDCGGTRSVAMVADAPPSRILRREEFPGANYRLITTGQLSEHFRAIAAWAGSAPVLGVGVGMAGVRERDDALRIEAVLREVWPGAAVFAAHDLETALAAAGPVEGSGWAGRVITLSGTGSCCYGRSEVGRVAKVGGWGHLLGDKGSGYEIGLRALKAVVYHLDRDGTWSRLGQRILAALHLNEPEELIGWVQEAKKSDVARLAIEVFESWEESDPIAFDILEGAASSLARDAVTCARRMGLKQGNRLEFVLTGSVLLRRPRFARWVARLIRSELPGARVVPQKHEAAWGAVLLGERAHRAAGNPAAAGNGGAVARAGRRNASAAAGAAAAPGTQRYVPASARLSPTEERNPRSMRLGSLSAAGIVRLMLEEESRVAGALRPWEGRLARVVGWVEAAFRDGRRLWYVGCGTSGRLGVLDASECPPTFSTDPGMVQGIIAGGPAALTRAVEGAEDDWDAGARAVGFRGVQRGDVVVGIAASGRTPFVWGALAAAAGCGARTVLLCFNPHLVVEKGCSPDLILAPETGPEVLTGSTRLKAGTATKLVLNIITTAAMVRLGKVVSNLMVDVNPSNVKLRDRAVRIVRELTGVSAEEARRVLEGAGWRIKGAIGAIRPGARRSR